MNTTISRTGALTPSQREAVGKLLDAVSAHDGVRPLNEAAQFALEGKGHAVHWLAHQGCQLIGYGQCDRESHSVQMMVDPEHRGQGVASALAAEISTVERRPTWWAFGNLPAARAMAGHLDAGLARELLVMERDLVAHPATPEAAPAGIVVRSYTPADASAFVEANALIFADHPEQGELGLEEFLLRTQEDWFDPEGLLLAFDDETGSLVGFHWTKTEHSDPNAPEELVGEVYVIGVHPDESGRGLGRSLLSAGLVHLAGRGVHRVRLYVEASSERVVQMYHRAHFTEITRDASYAS